MGFWDATTKRILKKLGGDEKSLSITWDGSIEGRTAVELGDGRLIVHVSNRVLTVDEINGATVSVYVGGEKQYFVADGAEEPLAGFVVLESYLFTVAQAGEYDGLVVPKAGTYFFWGNEGYVASLSKETIVPIDPKYLLKTIDLDSYGIGQVILGLFVSGGGLQRLENMNNFWTDVNTDSVLRLEMKLADDSIIIDQCVRTKLSSVESVSFSFTGNYSGNMTTVSCCITRVSADGANSADIAIKVI